MGIPFYRSTITETMKEGGFAAVSDMDLETRIRAQEYVLARHVEVMSSTTLSRPCITDRTPLDMLAYMMGEVTMHNTPQEFWGRINAYREAAIRATDMHFDTIICLRPLPVYEVDPDKPPPNPAYQWEIQHLIEGAGRMCRGANVGHCETNDLQGRVEGCAAVFAAALEEQTKFHATIRRH